MDDFNEEIEKSSVDDDLDKEYVSELHFGGFDDGMNDPSKHTKTKQEIYKEIIKKSKKMRYEKQKLREENLDKVDEIDQDQETMKKILELKMLYFLIYWFFDLFSRTKDERKAAQQQHHEEEDDYDKLTKELYSEGKTYANNVSLKDPKKLKNEAKQKKNKRTEKIFSDDEENEEENDDENDDEFQNDDELEENLKTEKRKVGHDFDKKQKKTAKINSFLTKLQEIKREKMGNNELSSSNSEEDLEPSSDQEDSEDESIEAYS